MTAIELSPTWTVGGLVLTDYPYSVDADDTVEIGEPEVVVTEQANLLADGDFVSLGRHGNRTYSLTVYVEGATLAELANNEAALRRAIAGPSVELSHAPGDGASPVSVYEVLVAQMTPARSDLQEMNLLRKYVLTLTCAPFARSATPVTVAALPAPGAPTAVTVNAANSATGWTATSRETGSVTVTAVGTYVQASIPMSAFRYPALTLTCTFTAVSMSSTQYLRIETGGSQNAADMFYVFSVLVDGAWQVVPTVLSQKQTTTGRIYHFLDVGAVGTSLTAVSVSRSANFQTSLEIAVHDITRTNTLSQVSPRQSTRVIKTGGTERTPASLHVVTPTPGTPLSTVFVHTSPEDGSGYSPPLRRWRVSGNGTPTTDTSTLSGAREPLYPAAFVSSVPTSALPEGGYTLAAFIRCPTDATVGIYWNVGTVPPGGTRQGDRTGRTMWTFTAGVWMLVPLGIVTLPTVRTSAGSVQVDIVRDVTYSQTLEIDDAWLFREGDDCALSIVNVAYDHLWLNSPDLSNPSPTMYVGNSTDVRTHPGPRLVTQGNHVLHPDGTAVFTAASGVDNAKTDAMFYKRWHSYAAE